MAHPVAHRGIIELLSHHCGVIACLLMGVFSAGGAAGWCEPPAIEARVTDSTNLVIEAQLAPDRVILRLANPVHNWFAGTFSQLPTEQPVTMGFTMDGNGSARSRADVAKWQGLRPVLTYANPLLPSAYEWFYKDAKGTWISGDPLKTGEAARAGTGKVPLQTAIPAAVAPTCLSPDGSLWVPWQEVDAAEALPSTNIFRVTQRFVQSTATVAMRVPCPPTYLESYYQQLTAARLPGVIIDTVGTTPKGRGLRVIRLDPPTATFATTPHPTILIYAREHATETDGSWVVIGMMRWLLSTVPSAKNAREHITWLLVPLMDPDAAATSTFRLGECFVARDPVQPEAMAYATYVISRLAAGQSLDVIVNVHNIECQEGPNLFCPLLNPQQREVATQVNTKLFSAVREAGMTVGDPAGVNTGTMSMRWSGWCAANFQSVDLNYEVNTRAPTSRLTLPHSQRLGEIMARNLAICILSPTWAPLRAQHLTRLTQWQADRTAWWAAADHPIERRAPFETLSLGY